MTETIAKFAIGQLIHHVLFDYRGVVIDIDPHFKGTDQWYSGMASSKPPKDRPWYHVLVDGQSYATYVAERNLEPDTSDAPVKHPELSQHFVEMKNGTYIRKMKAN